MFPLQFKKPTLSAIWSHLQGDRLRYSLPFLAAVGVALLAGGVASLSEFKFAAMIAAVAVGGLVAIYPTTLLWVVLFISFILCGVTQLYFPALELVRWAVLPISFLFLLYVFVEYALPTRSFRLSERHNSLTWLLMFFIASNIVSAIMNRENIGDFAFGMKGYFQLWGVLFAIGLLKWDEKLMRSTLPKFIFVIAFVQIPFALHQYFFIAPIRHGLEKGIVALDIVAGTFGGVLNGGGANAVLAVFMFTVWSCYLALWKKRQVSTFSTIIVSIILLFPVMINEAKVSIIYAVVVFGMIFRKGIFQNLWRFAGVTLLVFVMVAALFYTYVAHAPEGKAGSWTELISYTIEYNILAEESTDGRLTRGASIELWVDDHGSIPNTLIGYGVGATRVETHNNLAIMLGIKDPSSYGVGNLGAIAVLWESGLLGFFLLNAIFAVSFYYANQLERKYAEDGWLSGIFLGLQGAVAILYISMWHKNFLVFHVGYQVILVTLFGFIVYWRRHSDAKDEAKARRELVVN